jgi:hypothetical protein
MIRRSFFLIVVGVLLIYAVFNFFSNALVYDPLEEVPAKKFKPESSDYRLKSTYVPAWDSAIHEQNLFSPYRSYIKPKPIAEVSKPAEPPPRKPDLILSGIVLDTYGEYVAYIKIDKSKAIPMRKGDILEDVELIDISSREVVLKWKTDKINLSMGKVIIVNQPGTVK